MKLFIKNNQEKIKIFIYCFFISFVILSLTSKCSFLYPFNDWVDANAFFTVGKSMAHGIVPYLDIFEQKGVFLYLIYMIGYLISNTTFLGIFILEVLFMTFTLYYIYKIIRLFLSKKSALIIIPIFTMLFCTAKAFVHGGSTEEFSMPFITLTMYYFLKNFKVKELNYKEIFIAGVCAGFILLIKYTLLGFWFGFMACLFFNYIFNKKIKKAFLSCVVFLLGMFLPFALALFYFAINRGIKEFLNIYFYINIKLYASEPIGILKHIISFIKGTGYTIIRNGPLYVILIPFYLISILFLKINKEVKIYLVVIYFFTFLGIYFGLRFYLYYLLPTFIFIVLTLIGIFDIFDNKLDKINNKIYKVILMFTIVIFTYLSYNCANYKEMIGTKKEDLFQYKFASIINQEKNPTMINMGNLDCGVYTTSGVVPKTYYFMWNNILYEKYPENIDSIKEYVKNKNVMFVVYYTKLDKSKSILKEEELLNNYDLIYSATQKFENRNYNAYLFKLKEV